MRILAIRGCNLASLAGEFELDLARAPLGAAGVFAIVGNTGAGKSTLLDAMCVALFDRTPRLCAPSRVQVGRGPEDPLSLGATDVRTLLRRGAGAGWAEVDFESGDTRRYRARWTVRRARNRADGTLQEQGLTLTAIDGAEGAGGPAGGERLGGTKTETLRAIQQRLGLSFEQFRRSALLAQGEFAAFLRADSKDRSELLERMTGTEIYTRLSMAAHQRAAAAETRLRDARGAALAIEVLGDEERAATERAAAAADVEATAAAGRQAAAAAAAAWLAEAARRRSAHATAEAARVAAEAAELGAESLRRELAARRRAEALRPRWDEVVRTERGLALASGEVEAARIAAEHAEQERQAARARRDGCAALHGPIRAARIGAGIAERPSSAGRGTAKRTADPLAASGPAVDAATAAWLAARAALAGEIARWRALDERFGQLAAAADAIDRIDRIVIGIDAQRSAAMRDQAAEREAHATAVAAHAEAQRVAAGFRDRRGTSLEAARRAEEAARRRDKDIERLVATAAAARDAARAQEELGAQLAEIATHDARDGEAASSAAEAVITARVRRDERTRVVAELRRAAGYEHARAELADGEPCPLCGAEEHPWRDRGGFDDVIREAEARLDESLAALDAAASAVAELTARTRHRALERGRVEAARTVVDEAAEGARTRWRTQLADLGELLLADDPASPAAEALAMARQVAAREALESARDARVAAEAAAKAIAEALAHVQTRQANLDATSRRVAELETQLRGFESALERQRGERAVQVTHAEAHLDAVCDGIARWRAAGAVIDSWPADASRATGASHAAARSWGDLAATGAVDAVARTRAELAAAAEAWSRAAERVAIADAELAADVARAEHDVRAVEQAAGECAVRLVDARARRDACATELAAATSRLTAERIAAQLDADELRELLAEDPARVDALATELAARTRAVERARAIVAERARLVDEHVVACASSAEALADAGQLAVLAATADAATSATHRLAAALAADDASRSRRAAALAALEADERAFEVDRVLGEVIGSHDGKLFRSFAQSLTLDALLGVANAHLEELAPRYQLERVPRHDLELQVVDRDLGGEIRSVQSLSGGESFLVSLSLALGLSSMSAQDVRVRTLLIDEGFGTLDPSTLDTALAVLDRLQATGRQVGVISHVPALVERVGAHVRIVQRGGGRSEVIVADA